MSLNALRKGTSVLIGSARFLILKKLELDRWQLENIATGEWSVFTEHDLLDRFANAGLVFVNDEAKDGNAPADRALAGYPPDLIAAAENRIQYLKEIDRHQPIALTANGLKFLVSDVADRIRDARPPSWRTLSRDYRKWLASRRDIRAIIPRHGDRGGRGSQMLPEVSAIADAVIEELYMTPERKRVPEVHLEIVRRITDANSFRPPTDQLRIPSRRTVYREIAPGPRSR